MLIVCDVFREEVEAMGDVPEFGVVEWLPMGLHDRPAELRMRLQELIETVSELEGMRHVLLFYGLCGGGLDGLRAGRYPLVVPRSPDCIALLLGSRERHMAIQREVAGTYFYAPGWIRERRVPGVDRERWVREQYAGKFDNEMMEELVEADRDAFKHYERAYFIRTAARGEAEDYCKRCAAHLGWKFEAEDGDVGWMRDFLHGRWDRDRFVVVPPGGVLLNAGTEEVFKVKQPTDE